MTELHWIPLDSSTVAEAAIDSELIYTRFVNGGTHRYEECPPHAWTEFAEPETSPGKYVKRRDRLPFVFAAAVGILMIAQTISWLAALAVK